MLLRAKNDAIITKFGTLNYILILIKKDLTKIQSFKFKPQDARFIEQNKKLSYRYRIADRTASQQTI